MDLRKTPVASSEAAQRRLQATPRRDTNAERLLRKALWSRGLRFRVQFREPALPRNRIDIAFLGPRVAVFVDGCFWHRCPEHHSMPRANGLWWQEKLERNVARDAETTARLQSLGWIVVRIWEHEDPAEAGDRIEELLRGLTKR